MRKLFGLVIAALVLVVGYSVARPAREVAVKLPIAEATAYFQVWSVSGVSPRYELIVETKRGSVSKRLWEDWGPQTHANLYITPDNWLIVIDGIGGDSAVEFKPGQPPRLVDWTEYRTADSDKWQYFGSVGWEWKTYRFFAPFERAECISNFGVDGSRFRTAYQVAGRCR